MNRRNFLRSAAGITGFALTKPILARAAGTTALTHKERVDRALRGEDLDRPPFTFYLHYKRPTAQLEAQDHLQLHRDYKTDIVKVMNDFDYPKSTTDTQAMTNTQPYEKCLTFRMFFRMFFRM